MGKTKQYHNEKMMVGADIIDLGLTRIDAPKNMAEDDLLLDGLTQVTRKGFGTEMGREDVRAHVFEPDILYLIHAENEYIGFATFEHYKQDNKNVLFLEGIVLDPKYQGCGLFSRVVEKELDEFDADILAMRTQNPAVYRATENLKQTKQIFPNEQGIPENIKKLAEGLADMKYKLTLDDKFVMRNVYGCSLNGTRPECNSNSFFDEHLKIDYNKGDCVLIVSKVK